MKIIKEGIWKKPWSKEYACTTCEAVLLVEETDVKPVDNGTDFYCLCPICAKHITIKTGELPLRVKEEVGAKRKYWSSGDPF